MSSLIHAVSRVRAMEDQLLTPSHVDRIIAASSFDDAYAVLDDLGYSEESSFFRDTHDFEEVLETGLYSSSQVFNGFGVGDVKKVLTVLWDIQNLKMAIKAHKKSDDLSELQSDLIPYASYSPASVIVAVEKGEALLPLQSLIQSALAESDQKKWEKNLEEGVFAHVFGIARSDKFLTAYITKLSQSEQLKADFIEYSLQDLQSMYPGYLDVLTVVSEKNTQSEQLAFLETALDEMMVLFLKSSSLTVIDGFEPLFSFFWRKERNARIIRSLLLAKRSGMTSEEIRNEFPQFIF